MRRYTSYSTPHHWYPGKLRELCRIVGREPEYKAIYGLYSAWAHGDPLTTRLLRVGHGGLWHAFEYWARILSNVADAKKIILSAEQYEVLKELAQGIPKNQS